MELNASFLFEHELELRLAIAALSIIGGYALVKLFSLLSVASTFALEAYRNAAAASADKSVTGIPSIRTSAAGAR